MKKFVEIIADGLKRLGVTVEDDKFVSPDSDRLEGNDLEEVSMIMMEPQIANLSLTTDIGHEMIKDEFKRVGV